MLRQRKAGRQIERTGHDRRPGFALVLPEQNGATRPAEAAPGAVGCFVPGEMLSAFQVEIVVRRTRRRHIVTTLAPALGAMARDDLPQGTANAEPNRSAEASAGVSLAHDDHCPK